MYMVYVGGVHASLSISELSIALFDMKISAERALVARLHTAMSVA